MDREAKIADRVAKSVISVRFTVPPFATSKVKSRIRKVLPILEEALATKHIWNVDYKDMKDYLNRAVDASRSEMWNQFWRQYGKGDVPEMPYYDSPTGLHRIPSFVKKMKRYDGVYKKEVTDWAEAWLPYAEAVKSLKPHIEKGRKVDPNAPKKERYEAPRTSTGGVKMVQAALQKVVAAQAKKLSNNFTGAYMEAAERFLKERDETQGPYDFYNRDPESRMVVEKMLEDTTQGPRLPRAPKTYEMKPDAATTARAFADDAVKEIVERFLYKNTNKIGSVVERKGGLKKIDVKYGQLKGWGFSGQMTCYFADGTQFSVRNKAVYHWNYRGADYVQFPTTFHQIIWPDGKKSAMLSEKQMNEDWAKA